jgi:hypothetical protein
MSGPVTVKTLRAEAKAVGVRGVSRMRKADMIQARPNWPVGYVPKSVVMAHGEAKTRRAGQPQAGQRAGYTTKDGRSVQATEAQVAAYTARKRG